MSFDRLKRIQETYECTKLAEEDEQHFGGGDCEDTGGLYGSILSGTSDGSAHFQSLAMGDDHGKSLQGEGITVVPWNPTVVFGETFVNPSGRNRRQTESDSDSESEIQCVEKPHISNPGNWSQGFNTGVRETLEKINQIPEIKNLGELVSVNGEIFLKKTEEFPSTSKVSEPPKEEKATKKQKSRKLAPVFPSQKKESSQPSKGQLLEGEEFLDIVEKGLIFDFESGPRYVALDSVDATIYRMNTDNKFSLEDWIKLTCA
ncbi:phosphoprotein [Sandjimba virus]|uniref:Phosphoprotein n=1 Tax=Sandjimba virus TaxID=380432 RepID=A0AAE8XBJ9_9RHAB|nr:phosphoprotein [Sandjimba virus]UAU42852.1 phosphoprotein [Sandjimba virus]